MYNRHKTVSTLEVVELAVDCELSLSVSDSVGD